MCRLHERESTGENVDTQMAALHSLRRAHVCRLCPLVGQISSLQATQMTQEAAIRDVDNERSRLKDKVLRMEEERESLQSQSRALDERQKQQLQSLEKVCGGSVFTSDRNGTVMNNQWAVETRWPELLEDSPLGFQTQFGGERVRAHILEKKSFCTTEKTQSEWLGIGCIWGTAKCTDIVFLNVTIRKAPLPD